MIMRIDGIGIGRIIEWSQLLVNFAYEKTERIWYPYKPLTIHFVALWALKIDASTV